MIRSIIIEDEKPAFKFGEIEIRINMDDFINILSISFYISKMHTHKNII